MQILQDILQQKMIQFLIIVSQIDRDDGVETLRIISLRVPQIRHHKEGKNFFKNYCYYEIKMKKLYILNWETFFFKEPNVPPQSVLVSGKIIIFTYGLSCPSSVRSSEMNFVSENRFKVSPSPLRSHLPPNDEKVNQCM